MIKRVVNIASNQKEAREWDIRQALEMSPEERQAAAYTLKMRVYGDKQENLVREQPIRLSDDIVHFLKLLDLHGVQYLIVGGEAVIYYGYPRLTGDIDLFYQHSPSNTASLHHALSRFWEGDIPGIEDYAELRQPGYVIQFGVPPNRIDMMNSIEGVAFKDAWDNRTDEWLTDGDEKVPVHYIGLRHLIENKRKTGRPKDLEDLVYLERLESSGK